MNDLISREVNRMTDEMRAREKAICEVAKVDDIGEVSDGFHTFNSLYEQRMILFAALVKAYKDKSWKSYRHEDGEYCFGGGWFIVGIDTPEGSYTYHYENKYWDMFDCTDLPRAKHWDGHTEADAEVRLMSLKPERKKGRWIPCSEKLPEEEYVLISKKPKKYFDGGRRVTIAIRMEDSRSRKVNWRDIGFGVIPDDNVLAWMPSPEPYQEGVQDETD